MFLKNQGMGNCPFSTHWWLACQLIQYTFQNALICNQI